MYKTFKMHEQDHTLLSEIAEKESRKLIDQFHVIINKYKMESEAIETSKGTLGKTS